jgi:hypothetical protein
MTQLKWNWRYATFLIAISICIAVYISYEMRLASAQKFYNDYYRTKIPAGIELLDPVFVHARKTLGFLPNENFEPWAVAVYSISDDTASAIKQEGIDFFKGKQQWREMPSWVNASVKADSNRYTYLPWKPTPVPSDWIQESPWGLCFPDDPPSEFWTWLKAAGRAEGFYTHTDPFEANLVIFPELKVVIYCYTRDGRSFL